MDNIFKILLYLAKHSEQVFTMHELSKLTKIPYATLYRTISRIDHLLNITHIGKATAIQLNKAHEMLPHYLILAADTEGKEFVKNKPLFKQIREECRTTEYGIMLFGSHAKNTTTKHSDIDLLIIRKDTKKEPPFKKYEILYKEHINPIYITQKEFKLMLNDKEENVGKQALKDHIILTNPALFWNTVKETWN